MVRNSADAVTAYLGSNSLGTFSGFGGDVQVSLNANLNGGMALDAAWDNFQATPEPTTFAMLGLGFLLSLGRRGRRALSGSALLKRK